LSHQFITFNRIIQLLLQFMVPSVIKIGRAASLSIIILTLCFLVLVILFPQNKYVSVESYIEGFTLRQLYPVIPAFLLVIANVPLFISLFYYAENEKKLFALTGLIFGSGYVICSGINYFIQLSVVPFAVAQQNHYLIDAFIMANPLSFAYALDNLAYLFLAISFLFFVAVFTNGGIRSWIKTIFIVYSLTAIGGTMGYLLRIPFLESMVLISALPYLTGVILLYVEFGYSKSVVKRTENER
jgi:hypothetical protein